MKYIILLIAIIFLASCSICKPPRDSREMEQRVRKHDNKRFTAGVRQWIKQKSDGYWTVVTQIGFGEMRSKTFECRPDSAQLENLKSEKPI